MAEYIEKNVAIARLTALEIGNPCATMADAKRQIADTRSANVAPVVHGRWVFTRKHLWYKEDDGEIDLWRLDVGFHNGPACQVCGESFCVNCNKDWENTECRIGHYECSACKEPSKDGRENFCPQLRRENGRRR